jgi:fatty acid synthase subunit alpha
VVPGNANGDDIDEDLRGFTHLAYLASPLALGPGGVRAVLLKSFGFGQASGEILLLHPDYLLASLPPATLAVYGERRGRRERVAGRAAQDVLSGKRTLLLPKVYPPYKKEHEAAVYLNPTARASWSPAEGTYTFQPKALHHPGQGTGVSSNTPTTTASSLLASMTSTLHTSAVAVLASVVGVSTGVLPAAAAGGGGGGSSGASPSTTTPAASPPPTTHHLATPKGLGVDVEPLATFTPHPTPTFAERNFTLGERAYCEVSSHPPSSWAGRWAAKEAVVKALCSAVSGGAGGAAGVEALAAALKGPSHPLIDIEIVAAAAAAAAGGGVGGGGAGGAPIVRLHGAPAALATAIGIPTDGGIRISISHSGDYAVAVAAI